MAKLSDIYCVCVECLFMDCIRIHTLIYITMGITNGCRIRAVLVYISVCECVSVCVCVFVWICVSVLN